jgi:hypothetical protein
MHSFAGFTRMKDVLHAFLEPGINAVQLVTADENETKD